jgi:hypothetical protein
LTIVSPATGRPPPARWQAALTIGAAMKNADDMLKEIIAVVDTNGDGKIQYDGAPDATAATPCID